MYKDEIKNLKSEKRESLRIIVFEFIKIYIEYIKKYPYLLDERIILLNLLKQYIKYDCNELEVLNVINKKFGNIEYNETIENLLIGFDKIYEHYYKYIELCLSSYENIYNNKIELPVNNCILFDNKYKEKVLKILRSM